MGVKHSIEYMLWKLGNYKNWGVIEKNQKSF